MTWLDKLEKHLGYVSIHNLSYWIVISQVLFYALGLFTTFPVEALTLQPGEVFKGQVWRLFTFLFVPEIRVLSVWVIFTWYLLFLYGQALEAEWGAFRFNFFIFLGTASTALAAMLGYWLQPFIGEVPITYLLASIFLAFAARNPDFELLLFFILPVKVKWLAWFTWALFALNFLAGGIAMKLLIAAACVNLAFFFGKDLFTSLRAARDRKSYEHKQAATADTPFHCCVICGLTEKDHSDMDFVYDRGEGFCQYHTDLIGTSEEERDVARRSMKQQPN